MRKISDICLNYKCKGLEALKNLDKNSAKIVLVIDDDFKLIGTIADGDIRRSLISGKSLDENISEIMNKDFTFINEDIGNEKVLEIMKKKFIKHIPVLDESGRVLSIKLLEELINSPNDLDNSIVIMAGGLGSRLRPYTDNCPKPMLKVGDKPILEILIENLIENGFRNFYISVNYLKEQIIEYFKDGSKWDININYLIEDKALGTAGSISLLPNDIKKPFLVMNGDLLTKFNLGQLIDYHNKNNSFLTICTREYKTTIPFGVVENEGIEFKKILEKPSYKYNINAGVYTFNPEVIELIPKGKPIDMPKLIENIKLLKKKIIICPIHEYWIDIGRRETLEKAHRSWD